MTPAQVLALHPDARHYESFGTEPGALQFDTSVVNRGVLVVVTFRNGGLYDAHLSVNENYTEESARVVQKEFATALTEKYGAPTTTEKTEGSSASREFSRWVLPKTSIGLVLTLRRLNPPVNEVAIIYADTTGGNAKGNL